MMNARPLLLIALFIGSASFAAALWFQYARGLAPCPLCITQRWALGAGLALTVLALLRPRWWLAAAAGLAFLAEAGVAFYHSGVERKIFAGPAGCSGGGGLEGLQASGLLDGLQDGPLPVACNEIVWSFLGLSMANWNVLIALDMAVLCLFAMLRMRTMGSGRRARGL